MKKTNSEAGRSLVETLSVLAVMVILLIAGLIGYEALLKYWRKTTTVKEISDVSVRYRVQPIACSEKVEAGKECKIAMKTVAPDMMRIDQYSVRTADGGSVSIMRSGDSSTYTVVAAYILSESCVELLENGDYDAVQVDCALARTLGVNECSNANTEKLALGRDYIKGLDSGKKEAVIRDVCSDEDRVDSARLINKGGCSSSTHGYYYNGKCYNCPEGQVEDIWGQCCARKNACGYCDGSSYKKYCSVNGTGCSGAVRYAKDAQVCDEDSGVCVECLEDAHCAGCVGADNQPATSCSNKHCCPPGQTWNGTKCTCPGNGDYCGSTCCTSAQHCMVRGEGTTITKTCCNHTGVLNSPCETDDCCSDGLSCSANHCCPEDTFWGDQANGCAECLVDYGKGRGACTDVLTPLCDNEGSGATWECKECPDSAPIWSIDEGKCVCTANYGTGLEGACPTLAAPVCDPVTKTCGDCPEGYWNEETLTCTACIKSHDGSVGEGACEDVTNPICDKAKGWTCQPCPDKNTAPVWSDGLQKCVCLVDYGQGDGACQTTGKPWCDTSSDQGATCKPCSERKDGKEFWSDKAGKCVECLRDNGEPGEGQCTDDTLRFCDNESADSSWTCVKCQTGYWNGEACVECIKDYDGTTGTGACETTTKPQCPKTGDKAYTCQPCSGDKPVWSDDLQKCVCRTNYGTKTTGACPTEEHPWCDQDDPDGPVCKQCPDGTIWNPTTLTCTECLRNNGEAGEGQCPEEKPLCDNQGENATWKCKSCMAETPYWNASLQKCVECLWGYGSGKTGSCSSLNNPRCNNTGVDADWTCGPCSCPADVMEWNTTKQECTFLKPGYVEDDGHCCPVDKPKYLCSEEEQGGCDNHGECCATDGSNNEFCCNAVWDGAYVWKEGKCVPRCADGQWARFEVNPDGTLGRCCSDVSSNHYASNGHCCTTGEYYPKSGATPGSCCSSENDSQECCTAIKGVGYDFITVTTRKGGSWWNRNTENKCVPECEECMIRKTGSEACIENTSKADKDEYCCKTVGRSWNSKANTCCQRGQTYASKSGRCCDKVVDGECFMRATNGYCYVDGSGQGRLLRCSDSRVVSGEFCIGGTNGICGYSSTNVREGEPCGCDAYIPHALVKNLFVYDKHNKNWCTAYSGRGQNLCYMCGKHSHHKWKHVAGHNSFCRKL